MKPIYFFVLFFTCCSQALFAQVTITSVTPSSPATSCTNTSVTIGGEHFCANYINNGSSFTVTGNTIDVTISYSTGFVCLPAIVPYTETVNLGNLSSGTYTLNVTSLLDGNVSNTNNGNSLTVVPCCDATASFTTSNDSVCAGDTVSFMSTSVNATSITWLLDSSFYSNSVSNELAFDSAGTYTMTLAVTGTGCVDTNTVTIHVGDYPNAYFSNDTLICQGTSATFQAVPGQGTYNWSTGSTNTNTTVNSLGMVSLTVTTEFGCSASDSASVVGYHPLPPVDITGNTLKCPGDTSILDAGAGYTSYTWFNTSTNQSIEWPFTGIVWVQVVDTNGCYGSDTIAIGEYTLDTLHLEQDSNRCGQTTVSSNPGYANYDWSTGQTTQSIVLTSSDTVSLTVTDVNGCVQEGSLEAEVYPLPLVNLGPDTNLCGIPGLVLSPGGGSSYLWNDGSTDPTLSVTSPGTYAVTVTTEDGCEGSDTVLVEECTGVAGISSRAWKVFPNPATDHLFIESAGSSPEGTAWQLSNLHGQAVKSGSLRGVLTEVDAADLPAGTYLLRVETSDPYQCMVIIR